MLILLVLWNPASAIREVRHGDLSEYLVHAGAEDLDPGERAREAVDVALGALHVDFQVADHNLGSLLATGEGLLLRHSLRRGKHLTVILLVLAEG